MTYTGKEDHDIDLAEAAKMTKRYRDNMTPNETILAEYFGKDALYNILEQDLCVGIRVYYALDANMVQKLVIVGVDKYGNDLYMELLAEHGATYPPNNPAPNPLNC